MCSADSEHTLLLPVGAVFHAKYLTMFQAGDMGGSAALQVSVPPHMLARLSVFPFFAS